MNGLLLNCPSPLETNKTIHNGLTKGPLKMVRYRGGHYILSRVNDENAVEIYST